MQLQDYPISKVPFCLKDIADVFIQGCTSLTPRQRTVAQTITGFFFIFSMCKLTFSNDRKRFGRPDARAQLIVNLTVITMVITSLCLLILLKKP